MLIKPIVIALCKILKMLNVCYFSTMLTVTHVSDDIIRNCLAKGQQQPVCPLASSCRTGPVSFVCSHTHPFGKCLCSGEWKKDACVDLRHTALIPAFLWEFLPRPGNCFLRAFVVNGL